MVYTDSPEVAAERQRVEARLEDMGKRYGKGLNIAAIRLDGLLEYMIEKLGDRGEAEQHILAKIDGAIDDMLPELERLARLEALSGRTQPPPGANQHVTPEEMAALKSLQRRR